MKKKIVCLLLALISVLSVLILPLSAAGSVSTELRDFSKSTVDEDLIGSTYKATSLSVGKKIENKSDIVVTFPKADGGAPSIIEVMEVGYDASKGAYSNIALYLWIYIPDPDFQPTSALNKVTLATAFDFNPLEKGVEAAENWVAESYEQFSLRHVNSSENGAVHKFIVEGFDASACINGGARRYNISRYDLYYKGETNAENYTEGRSYICTGTHADKTYTSVANGLDVLVIDELYTTRFRYHNIEDVDNIDYSTQINTVYFSIPAAYELVYDDLFSIKADWRRYRSTPMIVTVDEGVYNDLKEYPAVSLQGLPASQLPDVSVYGYKKGTVNTITGVSKLHYIYSYNAKYADEGPKIDLVAEDGAIKVDPMFWFFAGYNAETGIWDKPIEDAHVRAEYFLQYYDIYCSTGRGTDYESLYKSGLIQQCSPGDSVYGEHTEIVLASDKMDEYLTGYEYSSWWSEFVDTVFGYGKEEASLNGINAIQKVKTQDFNTRLLGADEEYEIKQACDYYLIDEDDFQDFRSFCSAETAKGNTVLVFHYATSVYETVPALVFVGDSRVMKSDVAYMACQDIFLDFTVIEMAFGDEFNRTIVPAASSNVNDLGDGEGPTGGGGPTDDNGWEDFLKKMNEFLDAVKRILLWIVAGFALALLVWLFTLLMKPANAIVSYLNDKAADTRRRWEERQNREDKRRKRK